MEKGTCQWVSVEERKPKDIGDVFAVLDGGKIQKVYLDFLGNWNPALDEGLKSTVTHWLEVNPPDPPKRKVKKEGWARRDCILDYEAVPGMALVTYETEE